MKRRLTDLFRLFIPPVFSRLIFVMVNKFKRPVLEYAPEGWETVLVRSNDTVHGWSAPQVVARAREKWMVYCALAAGSGPLGFSHEHDDLSITRDLNFHNVHLTYAYALARAASGMTRVSVLDYGGGLGHYFKLGESMFPNLILDFHVKEVPLMAECGREVNPGVHWHTDDSCLDRSYDMVMMTGSLPYIQDWVVVLKKVAAAAKTYLFLFRIPVVEEGPSFVAVQHIYGSQMLHQLLNQKELLGVVNECGFSLVREVIIGDRPYIRNAPEQCEIKGWLFIKDSLNGSGAD